MRQYVQTVPTLHSCTVDKSIPATTMLSGTVQDSFRPTLMPTLQVWHGCRISLTCCCATGHNLTESDCRCNCCRRGLYTACRDKPPAKCAVSFIFMVSNSATWNSSTACKSKIGKLLNINITCITIQQYAMFFWCWHAWSQAGHNCDVTLSPINTVFVIHTVDEWDWGLRDWRLWSEQQTAHVHKEPQNQWQCHSNTSSCWVRIAWCDVAQSASHRPSTKYITTLINNIEIASMHELLHNKRLWKINIWILKCAIYCRNTAHIYRLVTRPLTWYR